MIASTLQSPHDPMPDTLQPLELRLQPQALAISWSDGRTQILGARVLRQACRCAECVAARRAGRIPDLDPDLSIADLQPFGPGAVNLRFSDGHGRGIFPFPYLASLGADTPSQDGVRP